MTNQRVCRPGQSVNPSNGLLGLRFILLAAFALASIGCGDEDGASPAHDGAVATGDGGYTLPPDGQAPRCSPAQSDDSAVVHTDLGSIRGTASEGITRFLGVPFAQPPVGSLRFRAPERHACYEAIIEAEAFGPECPQIDEEGGVTGDEDCLHLNVYAPSESLRSGSLPVLFFVHGGGNVRGSSSRALAAGEALYDGKALASKHHAIVVTTNYRLGILGYLAHPSLEAESARGISGQYGILDVIAALEWVQRNIAEFGGDPDRVLLFGQSGGGRNVCVLMASPLASGLFSAAIMQSGACVLPNEETVKAESDAQIEANGCDAAAAPIECLRAIPSEELLLARPLTVDIGNEGLKAYPDGVVLLDQPEAVLASGGHNRVPFIVGVNHDEATLTERYTSVPNAAAYEALIRGRVGPEATARILETYPVNEFASAKRAWITVATDAYFICPARRAARAARMGQTEPVYRYFFAQGLEGTPATAPFGAFHGAELFYVFDLLEFGEYTHAAGEQALAEMVGAYWTSFAATGDPNGEERPVWPVYTIEGDDHLVLDAEAVTTGQGIRTEQCDFWDSLDVTR